MIFKLLYKIFKKQFYDQLVLEFIGQVPDAVKEPVLDFLSDRRVLFEKFLSIQAYHIQKARIQNNKSQDFYDGALMIIKAFLVAVNKKVISRPTVAPQQDTSKQTEEQLEGVKGFLAGFKDK